MKEAHYYIIGTPETARKYIPDFDRPIQEAPYLIILFPDGHVYSFNREEALSMAWYLIQALNEVVRGIELVPPPEATK